ncbi:MAG: AraC family transcriptional regulator [Luteibacter sp.]|uniref:AraC family transcriptional regulator n=1 Tax=Luteibacter sp. TaxID=1886636 RepID=UPI002809AA80|nr:AraC family transcriptional regulator [Luteibacter sp.]MDQ7996297.1 AraC family transcriptional regulator [Luteibacter sp.]MDQ8048075.1 AraC family transcriptional regulator [Luteibacter sp.]
MYRAESVTASCRPRTATIIVDPVRRSAALEHRGASAAHGRVDDLRNRDQLTEIHIDAVDGQDDDLLLIYRPTRPADTENGGAILFRRQTDGVIPHGHPPAVRTLAQVLFDGLRAEAPNAPLLAHVALALRAILPCAGPRAEAGAARGGLAGWQERRATAFMEERLDQSFPVSAVADACGLSVNHFSRAFRRSLGKPPHRWLLDRRIDRARELLRATAMSLADIALACGFAEQSHFTRVFTRTVGMPPGAWRRNVD